MFRVHYEIPPMRAVYWTEIHGIMEKDALESYIKQRHPQWKILKIEVIDPEAMQEIKRRQEEREDDDSSS